MLRFPHAPTSPLLFAVATILIAACGSRSQLLGEGTGGAASQASGSNVSASSTGGGGSLPVCSKLAQTGDAISYPPIPTHHGKRPALVETSPDRASVVFLRESVVIGPAGHVANAAFAPWGAWPSSLGADYQVSVFGDEGFAVAQATPSGKDAFSLLFYLPTNSFPSDMYLAPSVATEMTYDYFFDGIQWDAWEPAWPVALARGASHHLAAYQLEKGQKSPFMNLALVEEGSLAVGGQEEVACADAPFPADVAKAAGGFLVATATARAFGACPLGDVQPGPAKDLHIMRLDETSKKLELKASFDGPDRITHLVLAKGSVGAWVVFQYSGDNAEVQPPIQAVRLDESGAAAGPIVTLMQAGQAGGAFTAAALGPWLLVAWTDPLDPTYPTIRLDLFDEKGALVAGTAAYPSAWLETSLSLLPSPDGTAFLVAWTEHDPPSPAVVRVARFSCAD